MSKQIRSFTVCIIGNYKSSLGQEFFLLQILKVSIALLQATPHQLHNLGCLAPRRSAHVEHPMVELDPQQQRRQHAHNLLPGQQPRIVALLHYFVHILQGSVLLEQVPGQVDLVEHVPWRVVLLLVHLDVLVVEFHQSQAPRLPLLSLLLILLLLELNRLRLLHHVCNFDYGVLL